MLPKGNPRAAENLVRWEIENAMGISTVTIDGMTGRGLTGVRVKQVVLGRLNLILDIYRAMEVIARYVSIQARSR